MPGVGELVRDIVHATDDGRGTLLPGGIEGMGTVQGVRGRDCGGIIGKAQDETAWSSVRGEMDLENLVRGGRAADVLHGLPGQGRPAELTGGGMTRTGGDKNSNAGIFSAPACPGQRGHFGGDKPPPPTVPPNATCWSPVVH